MIEAPPTARAVVLNRNSKPSLDRSVSDTHRNKRCSFQLLFSERDHMAKKKIASDLVAPVAHDEPVKICFERILPDDLDLDHAGRRAMRNALITGLGKPLDAGEMIHVSRMAVVDLKRWAKGSTLKCRFLDGSPTMKKKVQAVAHQWEKCANIKFKFVTSGPAEIRISFYADAGSWSAVGKDALVQQYFPLHQPTMNYGWLRDDTDDGEYQRVVLHEFGHALGAIHEHQAPKFTRVWDVAAVMKYFSGPPNNWSPDDIKSNVLEKYSPKGILSTNYDPNSIMLYFFDGHLFADNLGPTNENKKLSPTDISFMKTMYPK